MRQVFKTMTIALVVMGFLVLVGCSQKSAPKEQGEKTKPNQTAAQTIASNSKQTEPTKQSASSKPISFGTQPVGSLFNATAMGIASVISSNSSSKVTPIPVGTLTWVPQLATKEIDLGITAEYEAALAWKGEREFKELAKGKGFPLRLIAIGGTSMVGLATAETTGIKTFQDIKGKRFAYAVSGAADFMQTSEAFLANIGLTEKDIIKVPVTSPNDTVKAVLEGRADVATPSVGQPAMQELEAAKGARFISLDPSPEAVAKGEAIMPGSFRLIKLTAESGFVGIKGDTYVRVRNDYLVARMDLEEEVVSRVLETLWDHNEQLRSINKNLSQWDKQKFAQPIATIPFHEAAVKFYQSKGVWSKETDAKQKELLAQVQ